MNTNPGEASLAGGSIIMSSASLTMSARIAPAAMRSLQSPPHLIESRVVQVSNRHSKPQQKQEAKRMTAATGNIAGDLADSYRNHQLKNVAATRHPPLPKPLPLERHQSEPTRRSIFNKFWSQQAQAVPASLDRSSSSPPKALLVCGEEKEETEAMEKDISFSDDVSASHRSESMHRHHMSLQEQQLQNLLRAEMSLWSLQRHAPPSDAHWAQQRRDCCMTVEQLLSTPERASGAQELLASLPTLPSPMKRFFHEEGYPNALQGMYPLTQARPRSILRESSFKTLLKGINGNQDNVKSDSEKSLRVHMRRASSQSEGTDTTTATSSVSSHENSRTPERRSVHFDPRVTVTEYQDNVEREWISDEDLERFKYETVYLANSYFMAHPELIASYHRAKLDPVTGTMRKRPLFSLPVLACLPDSQNCEQVPAAATDPLKLKQVAQLEVKRILLVDPNEMILALFERSLISLFPHAKVTAVRSGEEALRLFSASMPSLSLHSSQTVHHEVGFDIVIAEQRLARPTYANNDVRYHHASASDQELKRSNTLSPKTPVSFKRCSESRLSSPSLSFASLAEETAAWTGMSGSDLFQNIASLEEAARAARSATLRGASSKDKSKSLLVDDMAERKCLLVGVSVQPEKDSKAFLASGADCVWGKPPPTMNDALRDEIVLTLVKIRRQEEQRRVGLVENSTNATPPSQV